MSEQTPESNVDQKVALNLDIVEREKTYEPYTVLINGRVITMTDPAEIDWQVLAEIEDPTYFLRHAISEEDKDFLRKQEIPGWKFGRLIDGYVEHYGLDQRDPGKRARSII